MDDGALHDEDPVDRLDRVTSRLEEIAAAVAEDSARVLSATDRSERLNRRVERQAGRLERIAANSEDRARARRRRPPDWHEFEPLAAPIRAEKRTLLGLERLYVLWQATRNAARLKRSAVEVGTYRGGSARFLASALAHHANKTIRLHVFDTFAGHPTSSLSEHDSDFHLEGHFGDATLEDVSEYLRLPGVELHPGDAIDELALLGDVKFCLVHLDVDLYRPTRACLDFVSEHLVSGGMIVVDDFGAPKCPGIARAVSEFLAIEPDFHTWYPGTEQAVLVRNARRPKRGRTGRVANSPAAKPRPF